MVFNLCAKEPWDCTKSLGVMLEQARRWMYHHWEARLPGSASSHTARARVKASVAEEFSEFCDFRKCEKLETSSFTYYFA